MSSTTPPPTTTVTPSQLPLQPHLNPILIAVFVLSIIIIFTTFLYLIFRHRHLHGNRSSSSAAKSLPLFSFSSVIRRSSSDSDCAICLSKFHPLDKLRLLPRCCHAFHAVCIDAWLETNKTCPLCRSNIHAASDSNIGAASGNGSFRLEIGSVRRQAAAPDDDSSMAYSIGSFRYIVDGESEVIIAEKEEPQGGEVDSGLATDAAVERSWLGDYVDRLSATVSFRSSRSFFTGSSRRSEVSVVGGGEEWELDASRVGEEISEWFQWASGV